MQPNQEFRRSRRISLWIFVSVIVLFASLAVISFLFGRFSPAGYPPFFFGWWFFIPLFFFGFFFFFRWSGWGYWWHPGMYYYDPALQILRERFARGEITKEQYDQMKQDLEHLH